MSIVGLWSGKNYLKHAVEEPLTMDKPSSADGFGNFFSSILVSHNLGYLPLTKGYYDPNNNGTIYPLVGQFAGVDGVSSDSPLIDVVPFSFFVYEVTTTTVTFRTFSTSSIAGTFPIYIRVYIDPSLG